ncbi:MAG TPA: ABC transporter substrate-binding protein [Paenirhodobacter sp.]
MTNKLPTNWGRRDDAMVERALRGGASRRDLLKLFMAGGIGMTAGSSILLRAGAALAETPKTGGHLRAAGWSSSTSDTLDPAKASLSTDYVRICQFYNRLTFLNEQGDVQMELADKIESPEAKVWTVTLKKDVTFHNGKTLDSTDVVYSLKRHLDPAVGSKVNAIAKQMETIEAVDPLTVKITLAAPNADLPVILSLHHFMILADGTTDFAKANGTGAFLCEVFEPGVRSVGTKNPHYFKPQGPYLDSFEFIAIPDDNARVNALLAGDIQYAASLNPRAVRLLDGQGSVDSLKTTSGNYTDLNIRLDLDPGTKAGFAEGMKYLVNREQIEKSVMRGLAEVANDQPIPPSSKYFNAENKAREFDPERAKALFQKAGLLGVEIPIVASEAATASIDMAMVVQQAGVDIGMKFKVDRVPSDGYWSNYWLKAPVHFGNINPRPTPDILFSLLYATNAAWNESQYKSEKFDGMLSEARGMLDESKRKEIYGEMQTMISNEAGTCIPVWMSNVDAKSTKVKGLVANPLGGMMGYAFAEYIWLDA